ncbi:MAG: ATP-binding protein, partial [Acidobacteriota bacterium]|nr:ATP-binding protein [Acidobacteriota bacterium]
MFSLDEKIFSANTQQSQKIQTLIIGRLMTIFLLLIATWIWHSGRLKLSFDNFPQGLFLVFLISVGLTIVYFFLLRLSKNYYWQIRVQFSLDTLLITWLVWRTGDLTSPYITLYIVLIAVSSLFFRARGTLLMAAICVFLFVSLSVLSMTSVIQSATSALELSRGLQILSFHAVAFLVVGLLASRFSDRAASGEQLKETTKTLANLRVLHERIIESIRSGLITTDLGGNIYTFNAAATEITGYKSEEMIGKPIAGLLGNLQKSIAQSLDITETGEQPPRFETDLITPGGFAVRVGYSISPLFSEEGDETGMIITFQDLTEIRSMEENVRRKDRLAAVGRVAAGLAHEIRNPLGAMRGAIQVLQPTIPPASTQAALMDIVLRESDRLGNIITNFLTYARPRVSNFSETDVGEAVSDTITLLRHSPDIKETHVLKTELPKTPVLISADPTQLKQIFWNLARNSVQAMPDGGVFSVAAEKISPNRVRITFSDTGCGMSAKQVELLFEPFSNSTTGGTGLGLSIVYQIVRDHNGMINVRSREGEGTTITVELPCEYRGDSPAAAIEDIDATLEPSRLKSFLNIKHIESVETE